MPKIARPWSSVVSDQSPAGGLDLAIGEVDQLLQIELAVAIPVDDRGEAGQRRLRGIDRGQLLALEVAVLVGVGGLELLLEDAAGLLGRGVAVVDVDVEPDLSDGELDVAVGEPPDLDSLRHVSAGLARGPSTRPAASAERVTSSVEVDRRPRRAAFAARRVSSASSPFLSAAANASGSIANSSGESLPSGLPGTSPCPCHIS